ncbi:MAG: hypothetical protein QOJ81_1029, partial [Chloroflexota bacterium]|nr:hypothetical protein [Chloroflexota bacterium]
MSNNRYQAGRIAAPVMVVLGLLLGAQPVLADTELGHAGTVGVHSLSDTSGNPGAWCGYKLLTAIGVEKLVKLVVKPPKMKAVNGLTNQKVGWVIIVQRQAGPNGQSNPWIDKFTSTEQTAYTNYLQNAIFAGDRTITVTVPYGVYDTGHDAIYRINVKLIWHKPNGTVQGTALHRVGHYGLYDVSNTGSSSPQAG